ncbi:MAG: UDP-N-acetylmuramate dehydrogenase [Campylobacterota bacterium]|nr:UDP-N-acetylmuramate dehydrogenase [Campylobacterota bacterium]
MTKIIDFKKYTSINIGEKHKVKVINEIGDFLKYKIIGRGNNCLVSNNPPLLAILGDKFDYIIQKNDKLIVGAATTARKLLTYCKKNNIAHFELLAKLPGNMGGLVKMNAGLKEWEIFNYLYSLKTQDGEILKKDIEYSYRHTKIDGIIYEIVFDIELGYDKEQQKLFNKMRDNQPHLPSAGSCFKNPRNNSAGHLIENVGLKGYTIGGMAFSEEHANFLVNIGGGTFDEAIKLINLAKAEVKKEFDIELELEIEIV